MKKRLEKREGKKEKCLVPRAAEETELIKEAKEEPLKKRAKKKIKSNERLAFVHNCKKKKGTPKV